MAKVYIEITIPDTTDAYDFADIMKAALSVAKDKTEKIEDYSVEVIY